MTSAAIADPHAAQPVIQTGVPVAEANRVVLLLHGRGASAEDILSLGPELVPGAAYLAPQASAFTWYPNSFLAPRHRNEPFLSSALRKVKSIVDELQAQGIQPDRVVLAGFSQGACLASEFAASYPTRYAGVIALTGGLIGPLGTDLHHAGTLNGTPAYFGAGDPDPHVPWQRVEESADIFREMGADVRAERFPGMPHTVSAAELKAARAILRAG